MRKLMLASTAMALAAAGAVAQTDAEEKSAPTLPGSEQVAEQCLEQLSQVTERMNEEGYWFSGYRQGVGYPAGTMAPAAAPLDPAAAPVDPAAAPADGSQDEATAEASQGGADEAADGEPRMAANPWAEAGWSRSPGHDIRVLQSAAAVLAHQGDDEGCEYLVARLESTYDEYATELRKAGIEPGQVSEWRQDQIAAAVPVTELEHVVSLDDITGTEVRSLKDERLGTVEDVVLHPEEGGIAYVVIGHGGFLGLGEETTMVPWDILEATPGFETLLLDAPPEALGNTPDVQIDRLAGRDAFAEASQEVDAFWRSDD